jgi:hypothetical protein
MKQSVLLLITPVLLCLVGCGSSNRSNVTIISHASDGLDLKAVTDAALKSENAEEFEKKLNSQSNKINNLDLNEDNKIDYIKVTEIDQAKVKGFSLTVELDDNEEQEICTIQIEKDGDSHARAQTHGNSHIYGHNYYYYRRAPLGSSLIWGYMSSDHLPHRSTWGRGSYPSHFSESAPIAKASYSTYHGNQAYASEVQRKGISQMAVPMKSPNRNKVANNIKAPLRNPSTAQRAFQTKNPSKNVSRYGSSSSSRVGSSSSWGSSSRSGSSFGSGK